MSMGQEKAGLRKALWKGRPEGFHSQALLFHDFVPSCFTSPLSVPSLAAKTGAQPETQMDGFTRAPYSNGSSNSPAPTFSLHPGHSHILCGLYIIFIGSGTKNQEVMKARVWQFHWTWQIIKKIHSKYIQISSGTFPRPER